MPAVNLYTLATCPWCRKTKQYFTQHDVKFTFTDYDLADAGTQARIAQEIDEAGAGGFPFTRIGDEVVQGFQPRRFEALLGLQGS